MRGVRLPSARVRFTCSSVSPKVSAISSGDAALPDQPCESLPTGYLVRVQPRDILDQRGFERCRIVARLDHRAGQRVVPPASSATASADK